MESSFFDPYLTRIAGLGLQEGGFASHAHGKYRPDVTAWAILILETLSPTAHNELITNARNRLAHHQAENGSISISPDQPDAIWPTQLAIFAWHGSPHHQDSQRLAVQFLLDHTGVHLEKEDGNAVVGHDTTIRGWPWISHTHSWVQPTALSMLALAINGYESHQRVQEAERMLLNRQLPQGGWNYGNTTVLGKALQPFPESTGIALNALAGRVSRETVNQSLNYLLHELPKVRTPLSLCWGLLGLQAWDMAPSDAQTWLNNCLANEYRYGEYEPVSLCLLLGTAIAQEGVKSLISPSGTNSAKA